MSINAIRFESRQLLPQTHTNKHRHTHTQVFPFHTGEPLSHIITHTHRQFDNGMEPIFSCLLWAQSVECPNSCVLNQFSCLHVCVWEGGFEVEYLTRTHTLTQVHTHRHIYTYRHTHNSGSASMSKKRKNCVCVCVCVFVLTDW